MSFSSHKSCLMALAFCALGTGMFAAEASSAAKDAKAATGAAKADAKSTMDQFKAQAESFSKDHDALVKQLATATAEQRLAILEKMEERKKEFEAKLNDLHKQMRDEQRKQRISGSKH